MTHKRGFSYYSLRHADINVDCKEAHEYEGLKFSEVKAKIRFGKFFRVIGLEYLFNKFPAAYECFLAYILQAREVEFNAVVHKK